MAFLCSIVSNLLPHIRRAGGARENPLSHRIWYKLLASRFMPLAVRSRRLPSGFTWCSATPTAGWLSSCTWRLWLRCSSASLTSGFPCYLGWRRRCGGGTCQRTQTAVEPDTIGPTFHGKLFRSIILEAHCLLCLSLPPSPQQSHWILVCQTTETVCQSAVCIRILECIEPSVCSVCIRILKCNQVFELGIALQ
ncbi:hypothetical protein BDA96_02G341500 [Sorghum bicolor]|uniref:Uncharacterized protein n=1 Tax=Sorghum bicolor TaxID=4558 RepID=A0A921UXC8_SORBI|nr:hypothetical protein BDA96_02G341500 [Sorghum bicolor]